MARRPAPVLGLFWLAGGVLLGTVLGPAGWGRLDHASYRGVVYGEPAALVQQAAEAQAVSEAAQAQAGSPDAGARLGAVAEMVEAGRVYQEAERALTASREARAVRVSAVRDGCVLLVVLGLAGWSASRRPGALRSVSSVGVYACAAAWLALWLMKPPWVG
ncbi:MAG: hypothetical protein AAGA57_09210 [Planctomycetota bacterium]